MFGRRASQLVREFNRLDADQLGPYNTELVNQIIEEEHEHHRLIVGTLRKVQESGLDWRDAKIEDATSVLVHHESLLRNKRCLLAYLYNRMQKVKSLRWQLGPALAEDIEKQLNPSEVQFFQAYSKLLTDYMVNINLDLTVDLLPPKDPIINVRVLENQGSVAVNDKTFQFKKNLVHRMKREDAEPYILKGVLEHYTGMEHCHGL